MVENHKMVVENSGLLTVAALKHLKVKGKKVVSILSGGQYGYYHHGFRCPARPDPERADLYRIHPSAGLSRVKLVNVASIIAKEQGNVIRLDHNQFVSTNLQRGCGAEDHPWSALDGSQEEDHQGAEQARIQSKRDQRFDVILCKSV